MRTTPVTRLIAIAAAGLLATIAAGGVAVASHQWNDVPNSHWAHDEIGWLVDQGIANGFVATGQFKPEANIKRQQAAFWFANANNAIQLVQSTIPDPTSSRLFSRTATCPAGKRAVAGGGSLPASNTFISGSGPETSGQNPQGWTVVWQTTNNVFVDPNEPLTVWALCTPVTAP